MRLCGCVCVGGGGGSEKMIVSHSNLKSLDKFCLVPLCSNENRLIGDVGQRDQVLTMTVLGG